MDGTEPKQSIAHSAQENVSLDRASKILPAMSERDESRGGPGCVIMGIIGFLLPVLYVLGIGPAAWLDDCSPNESQFLRAVYRPLIELAWHSQPLDQALNW